jgi:hypothetical protein
MNKPETRTAPLGLRIRPSLKRALEKAASNDNRSVASLVEIIVAEWLRLNGYSK